MNFLEMEELNILRKEKVILKTRLSELEKRILQLEEKENE